MNILEVLQKNPREKVAVVYRDKEYTYSYICNTSYYIAKQIRSSIEKKKFYL